MPIAFSYLHIRFLQNSFIATPWLIFRKNCIISLRQIFLFPLALPIQKYERFEEVGKKHTKNFIQNRNPKCKVDQYKKIRFVYFFHKFDGKIHLYEIEKHVCEKINGYSISMALVNVFLP